MLLMNHNSTAINCDLICLLSNTINCFNNSNSIDFWKARIFISNKRTEFPASVATFRLFVFPFSRKMWKYQYKTSDGCTRNHLFFFSLLHSSDLRHGDIWSAHTHLYKYPRPTRFSSYLLESIICIIRDSEHLKVFFVCH